MDQVVCIKADWPRWFGPKQPVLGVIYTIREIKTIKANRSLPPWDFYLFEEIRNPNVLSRGAMVEPCFDSDNFRPVRRTSIDAIKRDALSPDTQARFLIASIDRLLRP